MILPALDRQMMSNHCDAMVCYHQRMPWEFYQQERDILITTEKVKLAWFFRHYVSWGGECRFYIEV